MKPTTINILYWVFTLLFVALMMFASFDSIMVSPKAIGFIHDMLGFPIYFIAFTGYAKLLGCIAILIPGLKTIKEWAYAGLFFDLAGATYAGIAVAPTFNPQIFGMLIWFIFGILSYIFWKKRLKLGKA
ncbi:hypothetical protein A4D02_14685 [Niastella koreensis]|uniref:DoxX family protein n=2 Tax=Niastella koreensis TaxID=354356 RepID=G8T877_NIAKG|nr:DoxX family protein [Niastella koreensis]AEV98028.1 hypothetical protein Niako_1661 [Niastella koreensis GR20-10]OQP40174.1 hypothetical protein A4D02_14685 [Niastella koreensis]